MVTSSGLGFSPAMAKILEGGDEQEMQIDYSGDPAEGYINTRVYIPNRFKLYAAFPKATYLGKLN